MSSLEKVDNILSSYLSDRGYLTVCKENDIVQKWPEIVGDNVSSVSNCERVEDGILYVAINSASWRNEMQFFKNSILKKIHTEFNCKTIKDIIFI